MPWTIHWEKRALKDMGAIGPKDRTRIARFLRDRVGARGKPREVGEALVGPMAGLWKYRIGDFRVTTRIEDAAITVVVVRVANRREVYR